MNSELRQSLERVARRFRHVKLWSGLALCWLAWAVVGGIAALVVFHQGKTPIPGLWLLGSFAVATATGVALAIWAMRSVRDPRWVARRIEAKYPELGTGLLAAVEQATASPSDKLGYLQTVVIRQALEHRRGHDWDQAVPTRMLRGAKLAHAAALLVFLSVSAVLVVGSHRQVGVRTAIGLEADAADVQVEPGDAELERGTSLLVVARFQGSVPSDSSLVVLEGSGFAGAAP